MRGWVLRGVIDVTDSYLPSDHNAVISSVICRVQTCPIPPGVCDLIKEPKVARTLECLEQARPTTPVEGASPEACHSRLDYVK